MRGRYPLTIAYSDAGVNGFTRTATSPTGIPPAPNPDSRKRQRAAAARRRHALARSERRQARRHAVVERVRRAPAAARRRVSVGYVGTRHRRLSRRQPELRRDRRQCEPAACSRRRVRRHQLFASAAKTRTTRCRWPSIGRSRTASAQGRVHAEQGAERGRRRRRRVYVEPAVAVQPQLRAGRLRPSAHAADGLRLRAAVRAATARTRRRSSRTGRSTASRPGCRAGRSPSAATTACCSSRAASRRSTSLATAKAGFGEAGPTSSGTTRPPSRSRATPGATPAATRSAGRPTGTSMRRCSGRSRSATTVWSSARSRRTC